MAFMTNLLMEFTTGQLAGLYYEEGNRKEISYIKKQDSYALIWPAKPISL